MDKKRVKRTILFIALGIVVFMLAGQVSAHLIYAKTNSLDYRWFIKKEVQDLSQLRKGEYVTVPHFTKDIENCNPCRLTKKIACVEGDELTVTGNQFFCNHEWVATAKEISLKGKPLVHFEWNGTIPERKLFLAGSHKDSYDSRYFGFKEKKDVEVIAVPLF
ncbi:MAG: S26 family signal peptidase [Proteobacteria bacterium]|nr:S26 family signal peptidase [Pseudomonadota bacterium]